MATMDYGDDILQRVALTYRRSNPIVAIIQHPPSYEEMHIPEELTKTLDGTSPKMMFKMLYDVCRQS